MPPYAKFKAPGGSFHAPSGRYEFKRGGVRIGIKPWRRYKTQEPKVDKYGALVDRKPIRHASARGSVQLTWRNLDKLEKRINALASLDQLAVMTELGREWLEGSQEYVPVRTGRLKASGRLALNWGRGGIRIRILYGGPQAPYAVVVHERLKIRGLPKTSFSRRVGGNTFGYRRKGGLGLDYAVEAPHQRKGPQQIIVRDKRDRKGQRRRTIVRRPGSISTVGRFQARVSITRGPKYLERFAIEHRQAFALNLTKKLRIDIRAKQNARRKIKYGVTPSVQFGTDVLRP